MRAVTRLAKKKKLQHSRIIDRIPIPAVATYPALFLGLDSAHVDQLWLARIGLVCTTVMESV